MGNVARLAFKDISKDINDRYGDKGPLWLGNNIITPSKMFNKQSRYLNKQLGLNTINYKGNVNRLIKT
jgi:hypothetical protein